MQVVKIPATSANLGPGFDCIGMSLNLYNYINFEQLEKEQQLIINIEGEGKDILDKDSNNLTYKAYKRVFDFLDQPLPGIKLEFINHIPLARGLGSSAAAVVGGLLIANSFLSQPLSQKQLLFLATEFEGHPDNVAPALLGGIVISTKVEEEIIYKKITPPEELGCSVLVPNFYLSTSKARDVLPSQIIHKDAVFNLSRVALLVSAFHCGDLELLKVAMEDRLHQPYRSKLIPGLDEIFNKATELNLLGVAISGAGPSILLLHQKDQLSNLSELQKIMKKHGVDSQLLNLIPTVDGATIL